LNSAGKTIDSELEEINFKKAGEVLAEIWNSLEIDGHSVIAEFGDTDSKLPLPEMPSAEWFAIHVRESQYFFQVELSS